MTDTLPAAGPRTRAETFTLGPVHLDVTDLGRSLGFWQDLIGLQERGDDPDGGVCLGTTRDTLLVLHPGARTPVRRGHAGLYHVALHLPDEPEFARVLARLLDRQVRMSPTEHVMSKAIYLDDPDGIGLELTLETPERQRSVRITPHGAEVIDSEGRRRSGVEPLDLREVLGRLPDGDFARPLPAGAFVGHVHLHVGDLPAAGRFYRDGLGFLPGVDAGVMADFHAGGRFEHRLAVNTWQGPGAVQPPAGTAGLRHFTVRFDSQARLRAALDRVGEGEAHRDGRLVRDASGNAMVLTA